MKLIFYSSSLIHESDEGNDFKHLVSLYFHLLKISRLTLICFPARNSECDQVWNWWQWRFWGKRLSDSGGPVSVVWSFIPERGNLHFLFQLIFLTCNWDLKWVLRIFCLFACIGKCPEMDNYTYQADLGILSYSRHVYQLLWSTYKNDKVVSIWWQYVLHRVWRNCYRQSSAYHFCVSMYTTKERFTGPIRVPWPSVESPHQ